MHSTLFTGILALAPMLGNLALGYEVKVSSSTLFSANKYELTLYRLLPWIPSGLTQSEPILGLSIHAHSSSVHNGKA